MFGDLPEIFLALESQKLKNNSHTKPAALNCKTESKSHLLCHSLMQSGIRSSAYLNYYLKKCGDRIRSCRHLSSGGFILKS